MAGMYVSLHVQNDTMRTACEQAALPGPNANGEHVYVLQVGDIRQEVTIYCTRFQLAEIAAAIEQAIMEGEIAERHPDSCNCGKAECPQTESPVDWN